MTVSRLPTWAALVAAATILILMPAIAELSGTDVMTRVDQREVGKDQSSEVTMRLVTKGGDQRVRKLNMLQKGKSNTKKVLIEFSQPADVRGTKFLVWRHPDRDDDRWLYLPSLHMVRRISAADKRASFVGSDFVYEDVAGRDVDQDKHTLTGSESVGGQDCYVVKSVPRDPRSVEFAHKVSWVRKDNFVVVQEKYYDRQGKPLKQLTVDDLDKIQGIWTVRKETMRNLQTGHYTVVTWDKVKYNTGLGDDVFTERYLRR
ncbi:MAG: outer membrane lipoprotein-sorting protein [Armatimonadetes bacterium]|nr:outer membrane lipoprotein-sorting protein [Armatimonadota bacterium]